jgi:uncharacterized coiled-coil protein SlyX
MAGQDEEYHFSETPKTPTVFAPTRTSSNPAANVFEKITRKNILLAIAAIVVVLVVYKLAGSLFSRQTKPVQPPLAPVTQVAPPKPVAPPPAPVVTAPVTPPLTADLEAKLARSEDAITQLTDRVTTLQDQLTTMGGALQSALDQLKQQEAALAALKKPPVQEAHAAEPLPRYYMTAAVRGRAWLVDEKGETTTVSLGDQLGSYGVVIDISPNRGIVATSSGRMIQYQATDR